MSKGFTSGKLSLNSSNIASKSISSSDKDSETKTTGNVTALVCPTFTINKKHTISLCGGAQAEIPTGKFSPVFVPKYKISW